ncbi:hypothetical protein KXD40_002254 [Peronospora effusa]|uniref:Dol-P-Glc:Glc(2)Man(9)GlcNAc(2)-PP-Dol alpha-1,2-glucosyltransferase n=1 Tax=Peronospora effusa TaxID=542832 RepID=A0A3M6V705_9STRA|nr:hypothetical protein DD238_008220 [Peronospora effusa]RQM12199.1 hypothetical protein DD237_007078 [Peronospora effusa]UIZ26774.1 hypothetical protein KXD40_002254 [Peronospora effusa]
MAIRRVNGVVLSRSFFPLLSIIAVLGLLFSWILALVNKIVPDPYMVPENPTDEIFHVPQAQKYCNGRFGKFQIQVLT